MRLGYVDDDYSDNGYWGHDDGTQDQCKYEGDASVYISITHNAPAPMLDPLDLQTTAWDDNGIPLMPHWAWQTGTPGS